ncbi:MAG: hypothetical protein Q8907_11725, partial [Bacteroidota bacterium]|nr:hypothetical protein [Bacteroidota bacterium]
MYNIEWSSRQREFHPTPTGCAHCTFGLASLCWFPSSVIKPGYKSYRFYDACHIANKQVTA